MAKNLASGPILAHLAQIRTANFFFFKNLAASVTRNHGQLSPCTISEKTNDPISRKLSDGRTDERTDGETHDSDFIGRCPTNVERPKIKNAWPAVTFTNPYQIQIPPALNPR